MSQADSTIAGTRVEYRPRLRDNLYAMSLFTALGIFFVALFVFTRAWNSGLWTIGATALLVLAFAGWPWAYFLTAVLWLDGQQVGADRLLFIKTDAPRDQIRRVVAVSRMLFIGPADRQLFGVSRFWSDEQIRAIAVELGLKAEGYARYMGGPL